MGGDDLNEAIAMFGCGYMSVKDAAWVLHRYRRQARKEATAADLIATFGAAKPIPRSSAYRAIAELKLALAASANPINESQKVGPENTGNTHQRVPESGTGERISQSRSPGFRDSGIPGLKVPENGTESLKKWDSNNDKRSGGIREGGVFAPACAREGKPGFGADPESQPPRPSEADLIASAERVDALAPGQYWGPKVRQFAPMYPLHWIEEAASIAAARGKGWEFVGGILRRYQREGGPDIPPSTLPLRATGTGGGAPSRRGPDVDSMHFED